MVIQHTVVIMLVQQRTNHIVIRHEQRRLRVQHTFLFIPQAIINIFNNLSAFTVARRIIFFMTHTILRTICGLVRLSVADGSGLRAVFSSVDDAHTKFIKIM